MHVLHFHLSSVRFRPGPRLDSTPRLTLVALRRPAPPPRSCLPPRPPYPYYGETDSDADTQLHTQRRQRRTPPHARSPARYDNQEEEETSEMSG